MRNVLAAVALAAAVAAPVAGLACSCIRQSSAAEHLRA